jgi:hypothetical protein
MKKGLSVLEFLILLVMVTMIGSLFTFVSIVIFKHSNVDIVTQSLNKVEDAERVYFDRNSTWTKEPSVLSSLDGISATTGESTSDKIVSIYFDYQRNLWLSVRGNSGVCVVREVKDPLVSLSESNKTFDGTCTASVSSSLGN